MRAELISIDGETVTLSRDITVVGRNDDVCDLVLNQSSVSKLHCLIVKTDGLLYVRDLGSTNGTKVNGQRVTRGALLPGDELAFASVKFRVHLGPDDPNQVHNQTTEDFTMPPKEHTGSAVDLTGSATPA
ncbi:FHA domain-containing protein [Calycomorphotria hydatis]|uniref:FHA domain protein n=1 Tax=Calycomorphotria hydatis TaxID=2528027 RepID=A0A517T7M7_9PLAN|nr:FHA domain-containing protein [Calycomorphotria hydatis]QDT64377.1 FHA domain protein [Calycomorphotria hydatis]